MSVRWIELLYRAIGARDTRAEKRDALINEVWNLDELAACVDLRAFPLPMRVGRYRGLCFDCGGAALHVYMTIKPRSADELRAWDRDANGMVELNTCGHVTQERLTTQGPKWSVERLRLAVKNLVLHEVYESFLFRGERILDPHDRDLLPKDQPW